MSRIRTIKPEFWTSEQIMECSPLARLAFIGMWNFCDDNGVHPASCKTLKAEVFPGDDITAADVQTLVSELIHHGLLVEFHAEGRRWWFVTGWHHQLINRPSKSRYPLPPRHAPPPKDAGPDADQGQPETATTHGTLMDGSVSTHGTLMEDSLQEGKGKEGKGRERKGVYRRLRRRARPPGKPLVPPTCRSPQNCKRGPTSTAIASRWPLTWKASSAKRPPMDTPTPTGKRRCVTPSATTGPDSESRPPSSERSQEVAEPARRWIGFRRTRESPKSSRFWPG